MKAPSIFIVQTSSNRAVTALLQLVCYPDEFLSKLYIFHVDIFNLHLIHQTNCQNKQKQAGAELGQAQVRLNDIVEVVIEVVVEG